MEKRKRKVKQQPKKRTVNLIPMSSWEMGKIKCFPAVLFFSFSLVLPKTFKVWDSLRWPLLGAYLVSYLGISLF